MIRQSMGLRQDYIHERNTLPGLLLMNTEIVVVDLTRAQWKLEVPFFSFSCDLYINLKLPRTGRTDLFALICNEHCTAQHSVAATRLVAS
jgi:hypothetical protein